MTGTWMRVLRVNLLIVGLFVAGFVPTPASADNGWIPAHFTCAGVSGVMADGNWTHFGAAGLFPGALQSFPFGTVLEDGYGNYWTVEDVGPWWPPYLNGRLRVDLYNNFTSASCYRNFRVYDGWIKIRRYGWNGAWLA